MNNHSNMRSQIEDDDRPEYMFSSGGFRLGRAFGVRIYVDWSLFIIFALIAFNLGAGVFPSWHPTWGGALRWGLALAASTLFFASVLAHELSHAVVARMQGIPIRRITLFLFGGVAHMESQPPSPKAEFWMAIVGPITSILIGVAATFLGNAMVGESLTAALATEDPDVMRAAVGGIGPLATLLLWLGPINILLGVFNIIPGFPLDGGRVLRSIFWRATGDLTKATRWAAAAGQGFAWILMGIGVMNFFTGALGQGIWLLLIGWFLNNAARTSYQQILIHKVLEDVPVTRLMRTRIQRVSPDLALDSFVRDYLLISDQHAFPVESGEDLVGLVCFEDVRKLPQSAWAGATVGDVMTPAQELATLPPTAAADQAFEEISRRDVEQIPVIEGRHLLGLVRRSDLLKWLTLQSSGPLRAPT